MKKTINLSVVLLITIFAISCGNQSPKDHDHSHAELTVEHHHESEGKVILNGGKLWLANTETTIGIENMKSIMSSFSDKENIEAYHILKDSLKAEFNLLLQNCTMVDEAHNQLHNYLIPMHELFEGIGSSDLHVCKTSYDELNGHLEEYKNYFE